MDIKCCDSVKKTILVAACHYGEFLIYFRGQKLTNFKFKGLLFFQTYVRLFGDGFLLYGRDVLF